MAFFVEVSQSRIRACHCGGIKEMKNEKGVEENQSGRGFDPRVLNKSRIESNWRRR